MDAAATFARLLAETTCHTRSLAGPSLGRVMPQPPDRPKKRNR